MLPVAPLRYCFFVSITTLGLIVLFLALRLLFPLSSLPLTPIPDQAFALTNTAILTVTPTETPTPTSTPTPTPSPTPTPTPSPTPTPIPVGNLEQWFTTYSGHFSVDKELLKRIALCESGMNPGATYIGYAGLFQFGPETWKSLRTTLNLDTNPDLRYNPEEAIKTAAFKLSVGGKGAWPNCNH